MLNLNNAILYMKNANNRLYYFCLIMLSLPFFSVKAQDTITNNKTFISINTGLYFPSRSDFKTVFGSSYIIINGLSFGIPITNSNFFLYGKAMFYTKKGKPIINHYVTDHGVSYHYTTQEGSESLKVFMSNLGVQYNININQFNMLSISGGITIVSSREFSKSEPVFDIKGSGLSGYFIGIGYEKSFKQLPFNAFSEVQYNLDRLDYKSLGLSFGGCNVNIGIRYYFELL